MAAAKVAKAAKAHADGPPKAPALRVSEEFAGVVRRCWPLLLGNVVEWYEFSVYGYLAPQMQANFFPGSAMATWLVFAVTFLTRPLGGIVLGLIADRWGRKVSVNLSILGMLVATVGQGALPTYRSGGPVLGRLGMVLLLVLRCLQGLSAGGEISAITAYMVEVAPLGALGVVTCLVPLTGSIAFFLANGVVSAITYVAGKEDMMDWAWRIPFVLALLPGLVAVWGRRRFPESEAFLRQVEADRAELAASPNSSKSARSGEEAARKPPALSAARRFLREHGCGCLLSMGGVAAPAVVSYVGNIWCVSYLMAHGMPAAWALSASLVAKGITIVLMIPAARLADTHGIGLITFASGVVTALAGVPVFAAISLNPTGVGALLGIVAMSIPHVLAMPFLFCAELFPTARRATGLGLSWNLGACLFGGFGGVLAEASLNICSLGPGLFISASGVVTAGSVLAGLYLQRRGLVCLTHLRVQPYWGKAETQAAEPWSPAGGNGSLVCGSPLPTILGRTEGGPASEEPPVTKALAAFV